METFKNTDHKQFLFLVCFGYLIWQSMTLDLHNALIGIDLNQGFEFNRFKLMNHFCQSMHVGLYLCVSALFQQVQ